MMDSRRKRVEQKGRFTITEIIPGSPNSSRRLSSPSFQHGEVSVANFPAIDDAPTSNGSCHDVVTIQPTSLKLVEINESLASGMLRAEELPETHSPPPEEMAAPIEEQGLSILADADATTVTTICEVSTPPATATMGSPPRKCSSPKKSRDGTQRARRVKRRGRFTIIELASDSPTSRKNADDLYDHRFVTTTSIGGTSVESVPPMNQLTRSLDNTERRMKPKRAPRSMPRLRQQSSRRSRRRSESPERGSIECTDLVNSSGNQQQQKAEANALPVSESTDVLAKVSASVTMNTSINMPASMTTVEREQTVTVTTTTAGPGTPSSQILKSPETNSSVVSLAQTAITISAAQFMQQQQTISSLIRQQHDLKQIINVLQEQQQQLITIPSQISELKRQRANINYGETRDEEMREMYMEVDKLTRANESLHSMLSKAEREARHHTLEIECLSEENDELRHRCGKLETRYMDERKQSFVLEEELQRLRMLSLTQQERQLRQQRQTN